MALTRADVLMWEEIAPLVPRAPRVLELGQANWYGDVMPWPADVPEGQGHHWPTADAFAIARNFYRRHMPGGTFTSIDKHGRDGSIDWNLNVPVGASAELSGKRFDVVINTGTGEHVFGQQQFFETVHDTCTAPKEIRGDIPFDLKPFRVPCGLMIHAVPICGWWEHGFYCYNPTFFADLAAANDYEVVYLSQWNRNYGTVTRLASFADARPQVGDSMLYVAYRKTKYSPFVVPMQGRYKGAEAIPDIR